MTVGRPIEVRDSISKSVDLIVKNPVVLVPQAIVLLLTVAGDLASQSSLSALRVVISVVSVVADVVVAGAYPSLVKTIVEGGAPSVNEALGKAFSRFWTLLAAGILVVIIVGLGLIALVVPGIIFATWYAYTVPAIMYEEKGATAGMSASKAFGRDKKRSTFLIFLVLGAAGFVIELIQVGISLASPLLGQVVSAVLDAPLTALVSVLFAYTYLTHGPSSVPAQMEGQGVVSAPPSGALPPLVQSRSFIGPPLSLRFCPSCGSPVTSESKFCGNCGKPIESPPSGGA